MPPPFDHGKSLIGESRNGFLYPFERRFKASHNDNVIQQGIERYEFNKMSQFQSLIPMVHLTFQIAKSLNSRPPTKNRIEPSYRKALKNCMQRTLWKVQVNPLKIE